MIYVITHKTFDTGSINKAAYKVLHVGKNDDCAPSYLRDDTGDNISEKNKTYCEMTGLYWIWKNGEEHRDDITGLVHYRRYFTEEADFRRYKNTGDKPKIYIPKDEDLPEKSVILPKKYVTLSTLRGSYNRCHDIRDLSYVRDAMKKICPEYIGTFEEVISGHKGYYFNMFICRKEILDKYCSWLFPLLFEIESRMSEELEHENEYQDRVYGFLAERLLQVWVTHEKLRIIEKPVFNTEERPIGIIKRNVIRFKYIWAKYVKRTSSEYVNKG